MQHFSRRIFLVRVKKCRRSLKHAVNHSKSLQMQHKMPCMNTFPASNAPTMTHLYAAFFTAHLFGPGQKMP
jgi:hypothetical protein